MFTRFIFVLKSNCDFATFATPKASSSVYGGDVVWVTGASSGIGRELAHQLSARGSRLILSSRRESVLNEVAEECRQINGGVSVKVLPLDLNDLGSLPQKVKDALAVYGQVDVLFNNGGVSTRATARNSSFDVDVMVTNVDYLSYVVLTKSLLPFIDKNKKGCKIVNTVSVAGKIGVPVRTSYCGAKHAVVGFFDALRVEETMRKSQISVTNVILGSTKTQIAHNAVINKPGANFGESDSNIDNGLKADFVCERILATAHAGLKETWIAQPLEMFGLYFSTYFPDSAKVVMTKVAAKKYAVQKDTEK